ncbi:hypothetical protein TRAPUB_2870 [Trametes pubescens]|uniref:F-box domain-containing protein n=1 Tax=Trametes pubescens TaxID=154538 RepID=A0A1M2VFD6_TRAPU|nr:hypothetical protein TRAPUB_2870 [Trametes pubescens]
MLAPLLPFKHLEHVAFILAIGPLAAVDATDHSISVLAEAWPNLRSLRLQRGRQSRIKAAGIPGVPPAVGTYPTIHALVILARHCPELSVLSLPRLSVSLPLPDEAEPVPLMNHPLESLTVQETVITWSGNRSLSGSLEFAMLLDRLFPRLLRYVILDGKEYIIQEVHNILEVIRRAREHDRLRGGF